MKFLFDLFPVLLFFGIFKWGQANPQAAESLLDQYLSGLIGNGAGAAGHAPILLATAVAIIASFGQIGYLLARRRKVDPMLWMSLAIITVFGGATIYFNNETFIKWKPTVLYWLFSAVLAVSTVFFRKNLIRSLMSKQVELPDIAWNKLNWSWVAFFAFMGVANLYVAFNFSTDTWVDFKLFGGTGLMLVFVFAQALMMSRYTEDNRS
jgi:intracellular septation protein